MLLQEGRAALERVNKEMGLAFDEWDLDVSTITPLSLTSFGALSTRASKSEKNGKSF